MLTAQCMFSTKSSSALQAVNKIPSSTPFQCCPGLFTPNDVQSMMDEVLKMQSFNHPHVMTLIGVCLDAGPAWAGPCDALYGQWESSDLPQEGET